MAENVGYKLASGLVVIAASEELTRLSVRGGWGGGNSLVELAFSHCFSSSHQLLLGHFLCDFVPYNC